MTQFYSQHNEDQILSQIFKNEKYGTAIEIGAYDGITLSNTFYFEKIGWRTLLVEPDPQLVSTIKKNRKCEVVQCAASSKSGEALFNIANGVEHIGLVSTLENNNSFQHIVSERMANVSQIKVTLKTLDEILENHGVEKINFITIDVEGHELEVLKGFNLEKWMPQIVIIEDNTLGADTLTHQYMNQNGYRCFKKTHCNYWYAHKSNKKLVSFTNTAYQNINRMLARIYRYHLPQIIKKYASTNTIQKLKLIRNKIIKK
ncbi:MAG: FkbM family methyltransferase [Oligoflexia bacterium]|nr:FkbM family methyltransferase [Oligoflexia bacterium]